MRQHHLLFYYSSYGNGFLGLSYWGYLTGGEMGKCSLSHETAAKPTLISSKRSVTGDYLVVPKGHPFSALHQEIVMMSTIPFHA